MRTPHRDNKPGIVKIQFKDKDTKIAVLREKSRLLQDERYKRVFIRSSQPHIERVAQKNTMAILREMGIDHKYRFSGNGKLVPKQPAANGTQFGPYSAAAMATFPPTGPPPNQYRGPQLGYQFQNTLPPQVPMYPNFPRPASPTSVPPHHTHVMRPTDSLTVPSGEQAQQLPMHHHPTPPLTEDNKTRRARRFHPHSQVSSVRKPSLKLIKIPHYLFLAGISMVGLLKMLTCVRKLLMVPIQIWCVW